MREVASVSVLAMDWAVGWVVATVVDQGSGVMGMEMRKVEVTLAAGVVVVAVDWGVERVAVMNEVGGEEMEEVVDLMLAEAEATSPVACSSTIYMHPVVSKHYFISDQ